MKKVYPFTNENVTSFNTLYNFSNAKVLSVLGSGDQYFSSLLYDAKDIELYDCNDLAWDFFVLKYYGIIILSYEEFYDYFVTKRLNDLKYFKKLLPYLPIDVANRLSSMHQKCEGLSYMLFTDIADHNYNDGHAIPYLNCEKYYQLQSILSNRALPNFYITYLSKLPEVVADKSYDIILTSNIFDWMFMSRDKENIKTFKKILNKFNYSEIQAFYSWKIPDDIEKEFERNGFDVQQVKSAKTLRLFNDTVVSLRKK